MKILIALMLAVLLGMANSESCYSVQIITVENTPKNKSNLLGKKFYESCRVIENKKIISLKCGCYKNKKEATAELPKYQKRFKDAFVKSPKKKLTTKKTCLSVELLRLKDTEKNIQSVTSKTYPTGCLKMNLKNSIAVRCGCYSKKEDVEKEFNLLKKSYSDAVVKTTYAFRFNNMLEVVIPKIEPKEIVVKKELEKVKNFSYKKAKNYYENAEYKKSIQEAKGATQEYTNSDLHLIWAKSAQMLKYENMAMSAYERVLIYDANNTQARDALSKIYVNSDREDLAYALKHNTKVKMAPKEKKALSVVAEFTIGYDSNINVSSGDEKVSTSFNKLITKVSSVKEIDILSGLYIEGNLKAYLLINSNSSFYNTYLTSAEFGVGFNSAKYSFYMPLAYDHMTYLGTNLLEQFRVTPSFTLPLNKSSIININMNYASRTYLEDRNRDRNDDSYAAGFTIYYLLQKDYIYFGNRYATNSAVKATEIAYVDKDIFTVSAGGQYHILPSIVTRVNGNFKLASYTDDSRSDKYQSLELKLEYYYAGKNKLFISNEYSKNGSNDEDVSYHKNVFMFGLGINY